MRANEDIRQRCRIIEHAAYAYAALNQASFAESYGAVYESFDRAKRRASGRKGGAAATGKKKTRTREHYQAAAQKSATVRRAKKLLKDFEKSLDKD